MAQRSAADRDYSYGRQSGRYGLKLPFSKYVTPDTRVRAITRNYKVNPRLSPGYVPSITNLTAFTNQLLWSDDLSNAVWTNMQTVATANATTDTEGGTSCSLLAETAVNNFHDTTQAIVASASVGQLLSLGVFAKSAGRRYLSLNLVDGAAVSVGFSTFDLVNGVVATNAAGGTIIVPMRNGWFWIGVSGVSTGTGSPQVVLGLSSVPSGYGTAYLGVAGTGAYIGRATFVIAPAGAIPPIQTTTVARTINAPDVDSIVNAPDGDDLDPLAFQVLEADPTVTPAFNLAYTKTYCRIPPQKITPTSYLFTPPNYLGAAQAGLVGIYTPQATLVGYYGVIANQLIGPTALINGYYDLALPFTSPVMTGSSGLGSMTQFVVAGQSWSPGDVLFIYSASISGAWWSATVLSVAGSTVNLYSISLNTGGGIASGVLFPTVGNYVRKLTKLIPDMGAVVSLPAQVVENFYLLGVSPGVNVSTDIPPINPFNIVDYFAAWAGAKTWFNVTDDPVASWMGPILVSKYIQAQLPVIPHGLVKFTASSGNFTVPPGVFNIVRAIGFGGGGGGGNNAGGGGSGAPTSVFENIACVPGQVIPYTVGAGGAATLQGGSSTFGGLVAAGGNPGANGTGTAGGNGGGLGVGATGNSGGGGGGASDQLATGIPATSTAAGAGGIGYTPGGGGGACTGKLSALGGIGVFGNGPAGGSPTVNGGTGSANSAAGGGGGGAGANGGQGSSGLWIITW